MSYYAGDNGWSSQPGTLWLIIVGVNGAAALVVFIVVIWYYSRRRRASEYSQRFGMQITQGEVVSPMNSGPHIDGILPPYSVATVPVYSATVITTGPTGMRTGTGEDLILVPRSALLGGGVRTTNVSYYNHPPLHPSQQGFSQDMNMSAIREASGVYLARPPPPPPPPPPPLSTEPPRAGPGPVIAEVSSPQLASRQPVSMTPGDSQHRGYAQHPGLVPGEEDAPELDEHSIHVRTQV